MPNEKSSVLQDSGFDYSDITPIPLKTIDPNDLKTPALCDILYSDDYRELISLLRPLMKANEHSQRALYLTDMIIERIAGHYTVWSYRYNILETLSSKDKSNGSSELTNELAWCEEVALQNPKNYQIWHYRGLIIDLLLDRYPDQFDIEGEYKILKHMLNEDNKNYHVWSYRRLFVEKFDLFDKKEELQFVRDKINEDMRNNSAWNHLFFLKFGRYKLKLQKTVDDSVVSDEISFAKELISKAPTNPSSWNYLNGIYKILKKNIIELKSFVTQFTNLVYEDSVSVYAFELLAEIHVLEKDLEESKKVYELLAKTLDPVRVNYWEYKKAQLTVV
ncbi:unnamed protein product [Ambrosiozyma monospora]|uniref:Protein farnesyltransferase/geranylgeranyltransferase type-1 subunit alpha n=1 Tax=Ambrosiozyma monospora TaxID=43982 RepID=A0A9W6YWX2_AMBMO|nr:unnamed protein product [Ambrosiozyma monospora]